MKILLVNTSDESGGAEKIAQQLLRGYNSAGHDAWLAVGRKRTDDTHVLPLNNDKYRSAFTRFVQFCSRPLGSLNGRLRGAGRLKRLLDTQISDPVRGIRWRLGHEDFEFPGTKHLLDLAPRSVSLVHCHNLHGSYTLDSNDSYPGYFDLRYLSELSARVPVVLTLHDAWFLSGHCVHSFDCDRWMTGCGQCPDLATNPIKRDSTAYNWKRKRAIYARSRLYVATPSQWLMEKVKKSILSPAILDSRVIPNGINLTVFAAKPKSIARSETALAPDSKVILVSGNSVRDNRFKDYDTLRAAIEVAGRQLLSERLILVVLGGSGPSERFGRTEIQFVPFQRNERMVASYYQAADLYVHSAKIETFPTAILEAMACGTPVIASAVGGIPEQIKNEDTGFLVPPGDVASMSSRIVQLLRNDALSRAMSIRATLEAQRYSVERMTSLYLEWFDAICRKQPTRGGPEWCEERGCQIAGRVDVAHA